ncbi:site-2 protease family protein [Rhabdothermincola salaria]|uniref:site-2 protease family protein n=1 Tax=Rhabdothermincola salaria TaxID=2903142 RepID=UPI001E5DE97C|nr:site-2 protease family protein [Rhabdothermincola salaria]MCD9622865.1 site-2 protease family protein [Rhabdothermincola salaria]
MRETVSFGRLAGIRVGANWSVLIIGWILAFGLAAGVLPEAAPGHATGLYWVAGLLATAVFLGSLLAHEMAHALVARAKGLPVEGITLWALGGVSKLGGDASRARDELRIAIAGPATSLVLGVAFFATAAGLAALGAGDLVVTTVVWLATINVVLGLFNLAPAFPLDGGRVVRALLWARHGDRLQATRSAAAVGRAFGFGLVGLGVMVVFLGAVFQGVWFMLLGWFVVSMGQAEATGVEQRRLLEDVTVDEVMSAPVACVPADLTVDRLVDEHVLTHRWSAYPVVDDDDRLLGLATLDTVRRVPAEERSSTRVLDAGFPAAEVPQAPPGASLADQLATLSASPVGRLVVVDQGRVVGLVSRTDVVSCLQRRSLMSS